MALTEAQKRFVSTYDTFFHPVCNDCTNYTEDASCPAFPEGIPEEILIGDFKHTEVIDNQVGDYVFTKTNETKSKRTRK